MPTKTKLRLSQISGSLTDNSANAFAFENDGGTINYLKFVTTDDSEAVILGNTGKTITMNGNVGGDAAEAPIERDKLVTHIEPHDCGGRDIQYYLSIANIGLRHINAVHLNIHQQVRRAIVIDNPLVNRADNVRAAGVQRREQPYGRISRSCTERLSRKASRLNSRSM